MTRSWATRRAIRQQPGRSPGSTAWPATSASSATASARSPSSSTSATAASTARASCTSPDTSAWVASGRPRHTRACPAGHRRAPPPRPGVPWHQPPHPADRHDQLGDRVLGGDRVLQDGGVQHPPTPPSEHPGRLDHLADGVEAPPRPPRGPQPRPPVHQHRGVEALIIQAQPAGDLPGDIAPQRACGLPSLRPSKARSTITVATTSAGTEGWPPPCRATSANSSGGNSRWRWSAACWAHTRSLPSLSQQREPPDRHNQRDRPNHAPSAGS